MTEFTEKPRAAVRPGAAALSGALRTLLCAALLVPLPGAAAAPAEGASAAPRLGTVTNGVVGRLVPVGPARVDIGTFPTNESRTARFELRNEGPGPVDIVSVSKSCSCADAEVSRKHAEPGETLGISLRTLPGTLTGPFGKSFYVVTSATGDARVVQLSVAGRAVVPDIVPGLGAGLGAVTAPATVAPPAVPPVATAADAPPAAAPVAIAADGPVDAQPPRPGLDSGIPVAEFFVQEGCAECKLLRREFLPQARERYGDRVRIVVSDTGDRRVFLRMLDVLEARRIVANEPLYLVVDGRRVLSGWDAIRRDGFALLDARLAGREAGGESPAPSAGPPSAAVSTDAAVRLFGRFTPSLVATAGLADGLNPCAFATIVFLTSLLATGGRRGRAVFLGGLAFCLASFATYFLIGLGLLSFLRGLEGLDGVRKAVEWTTVAGLAVLGALSLLDAWRYARTADARTVRLQLPDGVKQRIRRFARARWNGPAVFGTGLACGAGVTLLESVCTGQMYLPTLVFMSREGGGGRAWGLLLLYNAAFIVPLFAVFVLGAFGVRSQRLADWTRSHIVPSKLLLAAVFLALGLALALRSSF